MQFGLGSIRQWHWISAAVSLAGMLMFALTGITLNHAADISVEPEVVTIDAQLPDALISALRRANPEDRHHQVPPALNAWLTTKHDIRISQQAHVEWSDEEMYFAMAGPGVDAWLAVDLAFNELIYERTDRGWIAYFNDLHKGRDSGPVWGWFIDIFAAVCVIFCVTGLILLTRQTRHRPMTWPLTSLGLVLPVILLLLFVH
ncbi:PepSY-associated TM helix domain-containing protein [Alteromonas halophila]|uniref:Membrane protein n=1 Tax=Alteromonas halophila TaxID=516698 RepID=A0A918N192_9ALTE|nr:PepSY-associated TM helix domain-containing protein [Alteromonas halophila]GGW92821.1 membrane protein [Alteromonas halophila]